MRLTPLAALCAAAAVVAFDPPAHADDEPAAPAVKLSVLVPKSGKPQAGALCQVKCESPGKQLRWEIAGHVGEFGVCERVVSFVPGVPGAKLLVRVSTSLNDVLGEGELVEVIVPAPAPPTPPAPADPFGGRVVDAYNGDPTPAAARKVLAVQLGELYRRAAVICLDPETATAADMVELIQKTLGLLEIKDTDLAGVRAAVRVELNAALKPSDPFDDAGRKKMANVYAKAAAALAAAIVGP